MTSQVNRMTQVKHTKWQIKILKINPNRKRKRNLKRRSKRSKATKKGKWRTWTSGFRTQKKSLGRLQRRVRRNRQLGFKSQNHCVPKRPWVLHPLEPMRPLPATNTNKSKNNLNSLQIQIFCRLIRTNKFKTAIPAERWCITTKNTRMTIWCTMEWTPTNLKSTALDTPSLIPRICWRVQW